MTDTVTVQRDALRELFWEARNRGWLAEPLKSFREVDAEIDDRLAAMIVAPWQPIETAPRDGTVFDGWCDPIGQIVGDGPGRIPDCWFFAGKFFTNYDDGNPNEVLSLTHWQPLPEPPK